MHVHATTRLQSQLLTITVSHQYSPTYSTAFHVLRSSATCKRHPPLPLKNLLNLNDLIVDGY